MDLFDVKPEIVLSVDQMTYNGLCTFAESHEDSVDAEQIELHIYICFFIFTKAHSVEHLEQAIWRAKKWTAETDADHPDHVRRFQILDMMLTRKRQLGIIAEFCLPRTSEPSSTSEGGFPAPSWINIELERFYPLSEICQTTRQNPTSNEVGLKVQCLLNQASSLVEMCEKTSAVEPLNEALGILEQARKMVHGGDPHQTLVFNNLGAVLGMRFDKVGSLDDLHHAIEFNHMAVKTTPLDNPHRPHFLNHLGNWLGVRYDQTSSMADLDQAIEVTNMAVDTISPDDPNRAWCLSNLLRWLGARYDQTESMADLNRSVEVANMAEATPLSHAERATYRSKLGDLLYMRFQRTHAMTDLDNAIELVGNTKKAIEAIPPDYLPGSHQKQGILRLLGDMLYVRFQFLEKADDLEYSIKTTKELADAFPDEPNYWLTLAERLALRYTILTNDHDLNDAIVASRKAVATAPLGHDIRGNSLEILAHCLYEKHQGREVTLEDVEEIIPIVEELVRQAPAGHPKRRANLMSQRKLFVAKYSKQSTEENLRQAFQKAELLETEPGSDEEKLEDLLTLARLLEAKYELLPDPDQAINQLSKQLKLYQDVLELAAKPQDLAECLGNISRIATSRYALSDDLGDLHKAVQAAENVLNYVPEDGPLRSQCLYDLGVKLQERFKRTRGDTDLDTALKSVEISLQLLPPDHPRQARYSATLGSLVMDKYAQSGDISYLHQGIIRCMDALNLSASDCEEDETRCNDALAGLLRTKFDRTGAMEDIDYAVTAAKEVTKNLPQTDRNYTKRLYNLATILHRRYERRYQISDFEDALSAAESAIASPNATREDLSAAYHTMSGVLITHYVVMPSNVRYLDRAIHAAETALELTPPDHPNRPRALHNVSSKLVARAMKTDASVEDLDRAEIVFREVLAVTPNHSLNRAIYLANWGFFLELKYRKTGLLIDLETSAKAFEESWNFCLASPSQRILAASRAGAALVALAQRAEADSAKSKWAKAACILREAVSLLPSVSPRSLSQDDQRERQMLYFGLTSLATVASLEAEVPVANIVELLEHGRGVILGLLFDIRSDIRELRDKNAELAAEFEKLRDELRDPPLPAQAPGSIVSSPYVDMGNDTATVRSESTRRELATISFNQLVEKIRREVEGFKNFLLPISAQDIANAACHGPIVIINVHNARCDAFIIESQEQSKRATSPIRSLPLHDLRLNDILRWANMLKAGSIGRSDMFDLLRWLWHALAQPVLNELCNEQPMPGAQKRRVWWIPTGPLAALPIHAAGLYGGGVEPATTFETVLDRVISSYSPSVKALLYTQKKTGLRAGGTGASSLEATLVSMEKTPACGDLDFAHVEVEEVGEVLRKHIGRDILRMPVKEDVIRALSKGAAVFHFAGHGKTDQVNPLNSALLMSDWEADKLTVKDLLALELYRKQPLLAYLSACSTGANPIDNLLDESIHLMSACQLAGFRHVIGSLWPVSDQHSVTVATDVYKEMAKDRMSNPSVSLGLHNAVRFLRDHPGELHPVRGDRYPTGIRRKAGPEVDVGDPRIWAAYIHLGM